MAAELQSIARGTDGTVWAWGSNESGQVGDGTTESRFVPVQLIGLAGAVDIAAGNHSMAMLRDASIGLEEGTNTVHLGMGPQLSGKRLCRLWACLGLINAGAEL